MRYMLLIYENESAWTSLTEKERAASVDRHSAFAAELRDQGRMLAGDGLQPTTTATTVRRESGNVVVTDGPFAETKEQLGGFYLIEARDIDQALADAEALAERTGETIEIRPIIDYAAP